MNTLITGLLQTRIPIIQAGMIWCSGWELAAAVSKAGGLGTLGAGSMYPEQLKLHLHRLQSALIAQETGMSLPFAVNLPLLYPQVEDHLSLIEAHKVPVVICSAGNPSKYTSRLHDAGCKVLHVISSTRFAVKAQQAGVDAVIAEGFEAGGHNGREETTTMCLIPAVRQAIDLPLVAAGGIGSGPAIAAALALGADGVQIGSRYAATLESSAHQAFKERITSAAEGDTRLALKGLTPVRLLDNAFAQQVHRAEREGATLQTLTELLGRGRAKKGMFEGDMVEGELEIGQVSSMIRQIVPAGPLTQTLWEDCLQTLRNLSGFTTLSEGIAHEGRIIR
jgi:enoyl-[acyl-carrier protein] reductase II